MPDVLKIAMERRETLLKEIAALDRFIEMAHALLASHADKDAAAVTSLKSSGKLTPTPAAPPADSQTEAFLRARELQVSRPAQVQTKPASQNLANLARS